MHMSSVLLMMESNFTSAFEPNGINQTDPNVTFKNLVLISDNVVVRLFLYQHLCLLLDFETTCFSVCFQLITVHT